MIAGVLIGSFYLISTIGMQIVMPADEISETSGLMDVLKSVFGSGVLVTLVGIGILYAFFAALIPWTIGANRAAAEAAEQGDLPPVFKRINAKHRTPVGAAGMTALVSASITLIYGVLFSLTNGDIDALFWSLFAFQLDRVPAAVRGDVAGVPALAQDRRGRQAALPGPRWRRRCDRVRRPGCGAAGPAAVFFFVWNPWAEFDATTTWLILAGLGATFAVQELFVAMSPRWKKHVHRRPVHASLWTAPP